MMSKTEQKPTNEHRVDKSKLPLSETDPEAARKKSAEDKLQLLATFQAMQRDGKLPHNDQLHELLEKLITNKVISSREHAVSEDGKLLLNDFRDLLRTLQKALAYKNKDELFQSLVYHLHCMESPIKKEHINQSVQAHDKNAVKEEGKKGSNALFNILKLMLINNEFRSVLGELLDISQDIFNDVVGKFGESLQGAGSDLKGKNTDSSGRNAVDKVLDNALHYAENPKDREQKANSLRDQGRNLAGSLEETARSEIPRDREEKVNSLHDQEPHLISSPHDDPRHKGLLNTGDSVHPDIIPGSFPHSKESYLAQSPLDQDSHYRDHSRNPLGQDLHHNDRTHNPLTQDLHHNDRTHNPLGQDLHHNDRTHNPLTQDLHHNDRTHNPLGQDLHHSDRTHNPLGQDLHHSDRTHNPLGQEPRYNDQAENVKHAALNHPMYQNARGKAQEHKEHAHKTVKQKIPEEKQDELIRRLQRALGQVQDHPEYQQSIDTIVYLTKTWSSRLMSVTGDLKQQAKENDNDQATRERAEKEVKAIIEVWAQGHSIDPLLHAIQNVAEDMRHDEQLRDYYHSVFNYLDRLVKEPGYISTDRSIDDGKRLMDTGRHVVKGRYSDHLSHLSSEARKYLRLIANDEVSRELAKRFNKIHRDLWMDREGNPAFKPQLFNDMKVTLLPALLDEIKYIPIPRIEYTDPQFDIVVENLIISGDTLLPNLVETKIESFNSFSLKTDVDSKPGHQSLFIRMDEIQADISDVVFFYKKKTGFPKLSDRGVASVNIGGKGISVNLRVQSVTDNPAKTFKVSYCKCSVSNVKIKIDDSNHKMLYKTIRPLVIGQIRKQIAKGIETKIVEAVNQLDQKVTKSIVNFNQQMQNKAHEALPEDEKIRRQPPQVSQARPRPGLFSTLVSIMNSNIKARVQKRNARKRDSTSTSSSSTSDSSMSSVSNQNLGTHHLNQYSNEPHQGVNSLDTGRHHDMSSVDTGRHHYIDSPPHSPKKATDRDLNVTTDLTNAQQGQQQKPYHNQL